MVQEPHRHGALLQRHLERVEHQSRAHLLIRGPADKAARIEIYQHGHIELAQVCGQIGDVACPLLIRTGCRECALQGVGGHDFRGSASGSCPGQGGIGHFGAHEAA